MTKPKSTPKKTAAGQDFAKAAPAAANGNTPADNAPPSPGAGPFGFEMIDGMTVLERKPIPVMYSEKPENDVLAVMINVYDFKNLELTTYVQQVHLDGTASPAPNVFMRPFRELASGYGIAEARAKLEQLGGNPPPLKAIPGFSGGGGRAPKAPTFPELGS